MSALIPIYEAIDVIRIIPESVGHTRPWVVVANTPEGLRTYVVKLYNSIQVEEQFIITREIVCNILAGQFELKVPQFALIDIPPELSFRQAGEDQKQYDNSDDRPKFATKRKRRRAGSEFFKDFNEKGCSKNGSSLSRIVESVN